MKRRLLVTLIMPAIFAIAVPSMAQTQDPKVREDLQVVLALKGKPCGKITALKTLGENDYLATCENGRVYRIRIDDNERVVVEERGG